MWSIGPWNMSNHPQSFVKFFTTMSSVRSFLVILLTVRQTDRQTERQRDTGENITSFLTAVTNNDSSMFCQPNCKKNEEQRSNRVRIHPLAVVELDSTLFNNVSFVTATAVIRTHSRLAVGCNSGQVVYALVPLYPSGSGCATAGDGDAVGRVSRGLRGCFGLTWAGQTGTGLVDSSAGPRIERQRERERGGVLCRPSSARWRRPACCSDDVRSDEQRFSTMTFHAKDAIAAAHLNCSLTYTRCIRNNAQRCLQLFLSERILCVLVIPPVPYEGYNSRKNCGCFTV